MPSAAGSSLDGERSVQIVRAAPEHAAQLTLIAWTAKSHWGYPAHWMAAWRDSLTIRPKLIAADEYFVALADDGRPVGFCAVRGPAEWWLKHLWVLPEWQGRGVGRRLFATSAAHVRERGGRWFDLRSDPNAEGFYRRMGAVRTGEMDATQDGIPRVLPELRYVII